MWDLHPLIITDHAPSILDIPSTCHRLIAMGPLTTGLVSVQVIGRHRRHRVHGRLGRIGHQDLQDIIAKLFPLAINNLSCGVTPYCELSGSSTASMSLEDWSCVEPAGDGAEGEMVCSSGMSSK